MPKRSELAVVGGFAFFLALAAVIGGVNAGDRRVTDRRASTFIQGPAGASGVREVVSGFGVPMEPWRRSYLRFETQAHPDSTVLAFFNLTRWPMDLEITRIGTFVEQGGTIFLSGRSGIEECFGFTVETIDVTTVRTDGVELPPVNHIYTQLESDDDDDNLGVTDGGDCIPPPIEGVDTVLTTTNGDVVALALRVGGEPRILMIAEEDYVTNETWRYTEVAQFIIPWMVTDNVTRIFVDEYHHGFGTGGSLLGAMWTWIRTSPLGWALMHLVVVSLLALIVLGRRLGKPVSQVRHTRRSELEHLDALGSGLQKASGVEMAVRLLISGLRRRLGTGSSARRWTPDELRQWLASIDMAATSDDVHATIAKLANTSSTHAGDQHMVVAAHAVEDLWNAMRVRTTHTIS